MRKKDLKIEWVNGTVGGQHVNKNKTACRITHIPTGQTGFAAERSRTHSERLARERLSAKLEDLKDLKAKEDRKRRWEEKRSQEVIRTYDYTRDQVKDHRTQKRSSIKRILGKSKLEDLRDI